MSHNDTPCKNCCFAVYDGITQVDCARGRIEKYRNAGSIVLEAYDEEKEFFVIQNRICPFYRDDEWLLKMSFKTEDEIESILKFETASSFHLIILLNDDSSIDDIKSTIDSLDLENSYIKPIQITLVRTKNHKLSIKTIRDLFDGINVKWRIENLLVDKTVTGIVHSVQKLIKSQYYCVCYAGYQFKEKYFEIIHNAVTDNLLQFGIIEEKEDQFNGMVMPLHVHQYWYFHGNPKDTIPENIKEYQCQNPEEKVIFQLKDLYA